MEGKEEAEQRWPKRVQRCVTREDFLKLFAELGIPGEEWKSSSWISKQAKLSKEEGGIGATLAGVDAQRTWLSFREEH